MIYDSLNYNINLSYTDNKYPSSCTLIILMWWTHKTRFTLLLMVPSKLKQSTDWLCCPCFQQIKILLQTPEPTRLFLGFHTPLADGAHQRPRSRPVGSQSGTRGSCASPGLKQQRKCKCWARAGPAESSVTSLARCDSESSQDSFLINNRNREILGCAWSTQHIPSVGTPRKAPIQRHCLWNVRPWADSWAFH